jgi:hypothetical protein
MVDSGEVDAQKDKAAGDEWSFHGARRLLGLGKRMQYRDELVRLPQASEHDKRLRVHLSESFLEEVGWLAGKKKTSVR